MAIDKEILDRLLPNYEKPEDLLGESGLLRQLTKALMERALEAEMATHLGYQKSDPAAKPRANRRNGKSQKTMKEGDFGELGITTPRHREATFEPRLIPKGQTRMAGLVSKILSMYRCEAVAP
jgi:putative transposase